MTALRIIPLGGLGEIGKNMMVMEYGDDMIVVDCGVMFPEPEMLGIDLVIPDFAYVAERAEHLRGIVITHGHEDHIGALPYLLGRVSAPIYATKLTAGLVRVKLREHRGADQDVIHVVDPDDEISLGAFSVGFFRVNHSIPDAVGLAIHTPLGLVVHTGDFKFDHTPVDGRPTEFAKLSRYGAEGVLLLFSDSTNVERAGYTPSEQVVGEALGQLMAAAPGRVIVATFASLISRVQQVIDAAAQCGRSVGLTGRSMVDTANMALELGYLTAPPGLLQRQEQLLKLPAHQVAMVTTGSQGEPSSALARMANRDRRQVRLVPGDTVVISASPIPGNEETVNRTIDNLYKQGARVLHSRVANVHVSGHASQEEQKLMIGLLRPRYFIPVHGEYRHLVQHAQMANTLGVPRENAFVLEDGEVLELDEDGARVTGNVPGGHVYVDGLVLGDPATAILRDRRELARDGIFVIILAVDKRTGNVVGRPDIVTRGFIAEPDSEDLLEESRRLVVQAIDQGGDRLMEWGSVHATIKETLEEFLYGKTRRRPMILPVAMEV